MKSTTHSFIQADAFQPLNIEDNSVQLTITSPPYPMIELWDDVWSHRKTDIHKSLADGIGKDAFEAMHLHLDKTWSEIYRVLSPGGFACINIGDATRNLKDRFQVYHNHSRVISACSKIGFDVLPAIIWRKPTNAPNKFMGSGMLPAGGYVTLEHEYILVFRKGNKRVFSKADKEVRSASAIFWEERNRWFSDVWTEVRGKRQRLSVGRTRKRSAAYPIDIPQRLILMYSMYGDTVLDPFVGTGTSALAAISSGRNSISIDNDESLLSMAKKAPTRRISKNNLNALTNQRLRDHLNYVDSKDMLFFRYRNEPMGIPVKTLQEKKMQLHHIKSISRRNEIVSVNYRKLRANDIHGVLAK